jgi:peptidyl-prolyl cis-trans isomerase C
MLVAQVNGTEIAEGAVLAEMQNHPAPTREAAFRQALEALVVRELLLQEAERLGIDDTPEADELPEEAAIRRLLAEAVTVPSADEDFCRRYYDNNRKRFRAPELFEAEHILFAAAPDDMEGRDAAKAACEAAIAVLEAAPERFAELARDHSACPSRDEGGRLGRIGRGSTVPEFETFLMSLDPGELCPRPVATRYGFHVVRLIDRSGGEELPFEAVRDRIAAYLAESSWRRAVAQYVQILAGRARVQGIELGGAETPLVQ